MFKLQTTILIHWFIMGKFNLLLKLTFYDSNIPGLFGNL